MNKWIKWKNLNFKEKCGFVMRLVEVQFHGRKTIKGWMDVEQWIEFSVDNKALGRHILKAKFRNIKIRQLTKEEAAGYIGMYGTSHEVHYPKWLDRTQKRWVNKDYIPAKKYTTKEIQKFNEATKIVSMIIECPVKKERFTIDYVHDCEWTQSSDPCDTCGSHGYIEVDVDCPCGLNHTITVRSW